MGRVEITEIQASAILTPQKPDSTMPGCHFTINPYLGCAFGCSYCYVREMQYGDDANEKSSTWGDWVKVKANALALLRKSGKRLFEKRVMMGSATDPYQPIERKLGLTRALLELMVMTYPEHLHIQTRSPLVVRDIDVLIRFDGAVSVGVSIPTDDDEVRKVFEPSAPSIPQRIAAMKQLHEAGIRTSLSIAPLLPCNPQRFGEITKGCAKSFWMGEMRYHWTDQEMVKRYKDHDWIAWIKPDREGVKRTIQKVWDREENEDPNA